MPRRGENINKRSEGRWDARYIKQRSPDAKAIFGYLCAARCIEARFDVKSLSEILGHARANIPLNHYVDPSMDMKKETLVRLSALFVVR